MCRQSGHFLLHWLDLNDIQIELREKAVIRRWMPESEIRSQHDLTKYRYAKEYDAILELGPPYGSKVALEYERFRKTKIRYEEICACLSTETRVDVVLYLTPNFHLMPFLLEQFTQTQMPTLVTILSEFQRHLFSATTWPVGGHVSAPISQFLKRLSLRKAKEAS